MLRGVIGLVIVLILGAEAMAGEFVIPRLDGAVDGRDQEWTNAGLRVAVLSRLGHVGIKNEPTGEADLRLAWDDRGLLVYIRVHDADRFESGNTSLYRADAVEFFLSTGVGSPDRVQVVASPGIAGEKEASPRFQVYPYGKAKGAAQDVEVAGGPLSGGYWLEARIGFKGLGIEPKVGQTLAVQVFTDDRDAPFSTTGDLTKRNNEIAHACWFPDRTVVSDPTRMYAVKLGTEPTGSVLSRSELDLSKEPVRLMVQTLPDLVGQNVQVRQTGKVLGEAPLTALTAAHLSRAEIDLPQLNRSGAPLELWVGSQSIGSVQLYQPMSADTQQMLKTALNTPDEKERLAMMRRMESAAANDQQLQEDLQTLLPLVQIWAEGRELAQAGKLAEPEAYLYASVNPMSPPAIRRDSPLYPIYGLYRARNLIWRVIQGGYKEENDIYCATARQLLQEAKPAAPENPIIRMYLGEPLAWAGPEVDANAPEWANHQRQALHKLTEITHWWAEHRQMPDGSFGGGWNDDVEMWRNWIPVMLAFSDPKSEEAQRKLCESIFAQPHMTRGYSSATDDVEHTSEDSADTITPMLYLHPDDAAWRGRALVLADLMRDIWTGPNKQGRMMFKNIIMNDTRVGTNPKHAYDTTLSTRAIQPLLAYWQRTRDPKVTPQITAWLDTWVDATAKAEGGKPAGIVPSAIHWPDGQVNGFGGDWWRPDTYSTLFHWPWYVSDMLHVMLMAYQVTGDEKYLQPIRSMATIRADYLSRHPEATKLNSAGILGSASWGDLVSLDPNVTPGSSDWCAAQMGPLLSGSLMGYRRLTGDAQFDVVLRHDADGYSRFLIDGNRQALTEQLKSAADAFAQNREAFTSEVRWTDRLFRLTPGYLNRYQNPPYALPNTQLIYNAATGSVSTWAGCRLGAVRWHTSPTDIAALVTQATPKTFAAELYHFGDKDREFEAELLLLPPGNYQVQVSTQENGVERELSKSTLAVTEHSGRIRLVVPSKRVVSIRVF